MDTENVGRSLIRFLDNSSEDHSTWWLLYNLLELLAIINFVILIMVHCHNDRNDASRQNSCNKTICHKQVSTKRNIFIQNMSSLSEELWTETDHNLLILLSLTVVEIKSTTITKNLNRKYKKNIYQPVKTIFRNTRLMQTSLLQKMSKIFNTKICTQRRVRVPF